MKPARILERITNVTFVLVLVELSIGGGGRLLAFGPITARMVLFALALALTFVHLFYAGARLSRNHLQLLTGFCIMMGTAMLVGWWNGAPRHLWWEDVKPLLYFFMLPFFAITLDQKNVMVAARIYKISAVLQATLFFIVLVLIHSGMIPFLQFYEPAVASTEFFFRGEITFFYKGFLYLCIGFMFIGFTSNHYRILLLSLTLLAILFTFTRGFLLALALSYALYYLVQRRWVKVFAAAILALIILVAGRDLIEVASRAISNFQHAQGSSTGLLLAFSDVAEPGQNNTMALRQISEQKPDASLLGDREFSDAGRMDQLREVAQRITPVSLLIGHGFGIGIPSRPVHMEISYAEILHKQGILGLLFWLWIFLTLFRNYTRLPFTPIRDAFFVAGVFVFFQSLTNQFVNNPIGLSMVLVAMIALEKPKSDNELTD